MWKRRVSDLMPGNFRRDRPVSHQVLRSTFPTRGQQRLAAIPGAGPFGSSQVFSWGSPGRSSISAPGALCLPVSLRQAQAAGSALRAAAQPGNSDETPLAHPPDPPRASFVVGLFFWWRETFCLSSPWTPGALPSPVFSDCCIAVGVPLRPGHQVFYFF